MKLYLSWRVLQMMYIIKEQASLFVICEGVQQKIFEIGGKVLCPLYPVDNLVNYLKEVEHVHKRNKNKSLVDVLHQVDSSCAECMFVGEADNFVKMHYNQKFKEELKIEIFVSNVRCIDSPLQFSVTKKGKTEIFYPAETELQIIPSNYKNFFGNLSRKANEINTKLHNIIERYVDLFGHAYCITKTLDLLEEGMSSGTLRSFEKFNEICDKLLTDEEFHMNRYSPIREWHPYYMGKEELYKGDIPPHLNEMLLLEKEIFGVDRWLRNRSLAERQFS